jgi:hypothetical protein
MTFVKSGVSYGEQIVRPIGVTVNMHEGLSHLLVTSPSKSRALECFVVEVAQRSTHLCMTVRGCLSMYTFAH